MHLLYKVMDEVTVQNPESPCFGSFGYYFRGVAVGWVSSRSAMTGSEPLTV